MKQKLIYILGAGRSGTTILDIVLGNSDDAISLGEINRFFKRGGLAPKREPHDEVYAFWNDVKNTFDKNISLDYDHLKGMFEKNEYHTVFPKVFLFGTDAPYRENLLKQYKAISKHTNDKKVLIESSKYPARAINASSILKDEFDIGYVYLKKDPVKVVSSFQKKGLEQPAKPYLASNIYYFVVNAFCYLSVWKLRKRGHDVVVLKYEDLIASPIEILDTIANQLEIDVKPAQEKIQYKEALDTGFLFDGNRIRLKKNIILQRDLKKVDNKGFSYYFTRGFNYLIYH